MLFFEHLAECELKHLADWAVLRRPEPDSSELGRADDKRCGYGLLQLLGLSELDPRRKHAAQRVSSERVQVQHAGRVRASRELLFRSAELRELLHRLPELGGSRRGISAGASLQQQPELLRGGHARSELLPRSGPSKLLRFFHVQLDVPALGGPARACERLIFINKLDDRVLYCYVRRGAAAGRRARVLRFMQRLLDQRADERTTDIQRLRAGRLERKSVEQRGLHRPVERLHIAAERMVCHFKHSKLVKLGRVSCLSHKLDDDCFCFR